MKLNLRLGSLIRLTRYADEERDQIAIVVCVEAGGTRDAMLCGYGRQSDDDRVVRLRRCTEAETLASRQEWHVWEHRVHENIERGRWELLA